MGIGQKKSLAKQYTERMDIARTEELEQESTLGAKQIQGELTIECDQTDKSVVISIGQLIRLIDLKGECVEVFIGGRSVGIVDAAGSAVLRERFGITLRQGRSYPAKVVSVSEFTDSFTAVVG